MAQDLFPQHWLHNTLLDDGLVAAKATEFVAKQIPYDLAAWLQPHFDPSHIAAINEAQDTLRAKRQAGGQVLRHH